MIDEKTIRAVNNNLLLVFSFLFPGLFVLETIYQIGLFSGGIKTVWDFLLLLFWSIIISIPFKILCVLSTRFDKEFGSPSSRRSILVHQGAMFPFLMFLAISVYIVFRLFVLWNPVGILDLKWFPSIHVLFLFSFILTAAVAMTSGPFYRRLAIALTQTYIQTE